jgi:benzoate-CoA ligase
MLKPGGIWLSPLEVEDILLTHPFVDEVAVVAVGNESGLDKPVAFIVPKDRNDGKFDEMENELREFVRSKAAHYKCPRQFHFIKELPRTATGKIQRFRLRAILSE